jgi:hypothetical protein
LEVAVDRGACDPELVGDLLDGVLAAAVGAELVVHVLRDLGSARCELGLLAARAPACAGGIQAVAGAFGHQGVLELRDRAGDLKEHPADRGRRVDALIDDDEVYLLGLQLLGGVPSTKLSREEM